MINPNMIPPLIISGALLVVCIVLLYLWVRAENKLRKYKERIN
jgi:hypothetical protein